MILESSSNNNFVGSVIHPNGNIAEALLKEGMAKCVDWSISKVNIDCVQDLNEVTDYPGKAI